MNVSCVWRNAKFRRVRLKQGEAIFTSHWHGIVVTIPWRVKMREAFSYHCTSRYQGPLNDKPNHLPPTTDHGILKIPKIDDSTNKAPLSSLNLHIVRRPAGFRKRVGTQYPLLSVKAPIFGAVHGVRPRKTEVPYQGRCGTIKILFFSIWQRRF